MISFKRYLESGETTAVIQEKCKPFLEQSKGVPLYRGYGGVIDKLTAPEYKIIKVRKDRKPLDTDIQVHGLINAYFHDKFGVNVRSEGLFATGEIGTAKEYGNVNYVFPVGEFKFVWGTHKNRPVNDTLPWTRRVKFEVEVKPRDQATSITKTLMDEVDWHSDNLFRAIRSGAEIALLCDQVILVPYKEGFSYKSIIGS
jgi:hypothetical protein